jgi:hypothetical protein
MRPCLSRIWTRAEMGCCRRCRSESGVPVRARRSHLRAAGGGRIINFADWVAASGRAIQRLRPALYVASEASLA